MALLAVISVFAEREKVIVIAGVPCGGQAIATISQMTRRIKLRMVALKMEMIQIKCALFVICSLFYFFFLLATNFLIQICSFNGHCDNYDYLGNFTCGCYDGYNGTFCENRVSGCFSDDAPIVNRDYVCNGKGKCEESEGHCTYCDEHWSGPSCDVPSKDCPVDPSTGNKCYGHGDCIEGDGKNSAT
jgi:hypothetical protein